MDSAGSRAQISAVSEKLKSRRVAIVVARRNRLRTSSTSWQNPVQEMHLYDSDRLYTHNAFRAPGAPTLRSWSKCPKKVDYLQLEYSAMRRQIFPHAANIDESNIDGLRGMSFVFVAIDGRLRERRPGELEEWDVPFVDVGMGVYQVGTMLGGIVRTTTITPGQREHVWQRVSFDEADSDEYDQNIQIADLNALNAVMAVIKWKKLCGFYLDLEQEH